MNVKAQLLFDIEEGSVAGGSYHIVLKNFRGQVVEEFCEGTMEKTEQKFREAGYCRVIAPKAR